MTNHTAAAAYLLIAAVIPTSAIAESIVIQWNDLALKTISKTATNPPQATRALSMMHTAIYDAWANYDEKAVGSRLGGSNRRPPAERTDANKEQAISYAAYRILLDLYPAEKSTLDAFMLAQGYDPADDSTDPGTTPGLGNTVAAAILEYRHHDGSNQLGDLHPGAYSDYTDYQPVNEVGILRDPNRWQPLLTPAGTPQRWLLPHWGKVLGFALEPGGEFRPGDPPYHGTDTFEERVRDMQQIQARLTDKQKMIAEYWEDGAGTETPPGHWNRIAQAVSSRDSQTLDRDVLLFFALTNAQFDAGIAVWDCKIQYDYIRPVSAVRMQYRNKPIRAWVGPSQGIRLINGEDWRSYITTPPFADYPSGHSAFSASSAEILMLFTGRDYYNATVTFAAGSSRIEPNVTPRIKINLYWATFSEAADQAGMSRRYGGIHFEDADIRARIIGRMCARKVWAKAASLWEGSASQ